MGIDGVRTATEQDSSKVTSQSVTTSLRILTQTALGNLREVAVEFPGLVLPDSIGHEVAYQSTVSPITDGKLTSWLSFSGGSLTTATLEDKDSGRKYSGQVEVDLNQKASDVPKYISSRKSVFLGGY